MNLKTNVLILGKNTRVSEHLKNILEEDGCEVIQEKHKLKAFAKKVFLDRYIVVKHRRTQLRIACQDLLWIKSDRMYIEVQTLHRRIVLRNGLTSFLKEHKIDTMIQTHRSYAVNLQHASALDTFHITIQHQKIPVSKSYRNSVARAFYTYYSPART